MYHWVPIPASTENFSVELPARVGLLTVLWDRNVSFLQQVIVG